MFESLMSIFLLLFSVVIHEYSHGWMAEKCGDDTARVMGRLTLNPIPHLDPIGSVFLPLFFTLTNSPFKIAWAKPVPVNPNKMRNPRTDMIKVGLAGPAANLIIAVLLSIILNFIPTRLSVEQMLFETLNLAIYINLVLAVFNMLPIPPLDGSQIVAGLLPANLAWRFNSLSPYGFMIVLALLFTGILGKIISETVIFLHRLLMFSI